MPDTSSRENAYRILNQVVVLDENVLTLRLELLRMRSERARGMLVGRDARITQMLAGSVALAFTVLGLAKDLGPRTVVLAVGIALVGAASAFVLHRSWSRTESDDRDLRRRLRELEKRTAHAERQVLFAESHTVRLRYEMAAEIAAAGVTRWERTKEFWAARAKRILAEVDAAAEDGSWTHGESALATIRSNLDLEGGGDGAQEGDS